MRKTPFSIRLFVCIFIAAGALLARADRIVVTQDHADALYAVGEAAAKVYGIEKYIVLGEHDCLVEPSVELRKRVTRLVREFAPHMVVTHRTCDYHADHRATGRVVNDATYLMGVPLFCPETPVPGIA